jgi:CheY-like chemotaxis protein
MRVVVFDDVLFARQDEYRGLGCELHFYEHADEAVRVVEGAAPDMVLMDYAMDEHLTGEEAITRLRERFPRGRLRIVGISSDALSNERLVAAGADDAVPKSHLRGYLRLMLRGRAAVAGGGDAGG